MYIVYEITRIALYYNFFFTTSIDALLSTFNCTVLIIPSISKVLVSTKPINQIKNQLLYFYTARILNRYKYDKQQKSSAYRLES